MIMGKVCFFWSKRVDHLPSNNVVFQGIKFTVLLEYYMRGKTGLCIGLGLQTTHDNGFVRKRVLGSRESFVNDKVFLLREKCQKTGNLQTTGLVSFSS